MKRTNAKMYEAIFFQIIQSIKRAKVPSAFMSVTHTQSPKDKNLHPFLFTTDNVVESKPFYAALIDQRISKRTNKKKTTSYPFRLNVSSI